MTDNWRPVRGYEGYYEVSDGGNVRSVDRRVLTKGGATKLHKGRVLRKQNSGRYEMVALSREGDIRRYLVHRLVAYAFIEKKDGDQVNHINGVRTDNRACNLEWCTSKENVGHSIKTGLRGPSRKARKVMRSDGVVFPSISQAAISTGTSHGNVWSVINGARKSAKGYSFAYVE